MVPGPRGAHALACAQLSLHLFCLARAAGLVVSADFNLGVEDDFRIPDLGVHRRPPRGAWIATAAAVVEILSPGDQTWEKLPFYAARGVEQPIVVDPAGRQIDWRALRGAEYLPIDRSGLLALGASELAVQIDWPEPD